MIKSFPGDMLISLASKKGNFVFALKRGLEFVMLYTTYEPEKG